VESTGSQVLLLRNFWAIYTSVGELIENLHVSLMIKKSIPSAAKD
jgi:hypothetical protein